MKIVILPYSATRNPNGFPGDYPYERKQVDDKYELKPGEVEVTEDEYKRRIDAHYATVAALNEAAEVSEKVAKETKQVEVEGYYTELKTLRVKLDGAEKISEADLTAVLTRLIDILMAKEQANL